MFSYTDVKRYVNDAPTVSRFKPWWEVSLDVLLAGLFLIMVLAWTKSFATESGGLICVPLYSNPTDAETPDMRYAQSRCHIESPARTIEFYPYVVLLQWGILFILQISWIWIPSVTAKFVYFYHIFEEIASIEPTFLFNFNSYRLLPEIDYTDENREKLKILNDRITFMLMDKNYLSKIYKRKIYIMTFTILLFILILVVLFTMPNFMNVNFGCDLAAGPAKREMPPVVCNVSPQAYLFGVLILHMVILLLMLSMTLRALAWYKYLIVKLKNNTDKLAAEFSDDYKGLPGYEDLFIILQMLHTNRCDGNYMLNTILYVLTAKFNQKNTIVVRNGTAMVAAGDTRVSYSFLEQFCIVNLMASELGLKFRFYDQNPNTLYDFLSDLWKKTDGYAFLVSKNIKTAIYDEIFHNIGFYSDVCEFKKNLDDDVIAHSQKYDALEKIKLMIANDDYPDHLILFAAANILKIKFVLITATNISGSNIFGKDVFVPFSITDEKPPHQFLIYIAPHYYYPVDLVDNIDLAEHTNQIEFVGSSRFRSRVRERAARRFDDVKTMQPEKIKKTEYDNLMTQYSQLVAKTETEETRKFKQQLNLMLTENDNKNTDCKKQ